MPESKLFLIDAHALCYRSYFAIKSLSTSYGQATNAVYGFIMTIRKILRDYQPEYIAVCFDSGKKTHREEKFSEYKINRPSMPDDLISQIPIIKDVVDAFQLPAFEMEGFEADDIIATIAHKIPKKGLEVVIVSDDKDMYQLIDKDIKVYSSRKDMMIGHEEAKKKFGIAPKNITDYIGLAGDKTDNIPGVIGVGDVTARDLINTYGTVEQIVQHIDRLPDGKIKDKISEQKDSALLSKELAILDHNVPLDFSLTTLKVKDPDQKRLFELAKKLEFRRLSEEFGQSQQEKREIKITVFKKAEDVKSLAAKIRKKGQFAFLLKWGEDTSDYSPQGMVVALGGEDIYDLPGSRISDLKPILEDAKIVKVTHDIKSGLKGLAREKVSVQGKIFDVMLAGYLLIPSQGSFDINVLAWNVLKVTVSADVDDVAAVQLIYQMYQPMENDLKKKSLLSLCEDIEVPLAVVLSKMETEGVKVDKKLLGELSKKCEKSIQGILDKVHKVSGDEINLNSPKQLSQLLFEKLELPVIKKTKTGFSTDEGVLLKLAKHHPVVEQILQYRQLAKLKSTYIDALPKLINSKTGKIHASFNQTGTETGRLSSNNPNLQNIPIRTDLGQQIRKAFIPSSGKNILISADYSQIELRILADLSGDKTLKKAFKDGVDIHEYTAALIFNVKDGKVTSQMRNTAKRVNFGIVYGMSAFGLAKDLNISQTEAQDFIDTYFARYPGVRKFMDGEIKRAEDKGYVLTILNRRRYIPEIKSDNMAVRQFAQRQAINTPVQGSAADLIKLAMINIQEDIEKKKLKSRMISTVHDELVFDVPAEEKNEMVALIRDRMEHALALDVPIKATIKAGKNWLDTKEI